MAIPAILGSILGGSGGGMGGMLGGMMGGGGEGGGGGMMGMATSGKSDWKTTMPNIVSDTGFYGHMTVPKAKKGKTVKIIGRGC